MGAYQLFRIEFKTKEARDYFEKINSIDNTISKPKRLFQYKDDTYECTYYMGWDGYGLPKMCLEHLDKAGFLKDIKLFKELDLTCGTNRHNSLREYKLEIRNH